MERTDFEYWKSREVARLLALVEAERRYYQEIVAALPVPLAILASDRSIVSANQEFRQLLGVTVDELRKRTIEQLLPSDRLVNAIRDVHVHGLARTPFAIEANGRRYRVTIAPIRGWNEQMEPETLLIVEETAEIGPGKSAPGQPATRPAETEPLARSSTAPAAAPKPFPTESLPAIIWQADAGTLAFTAVSGAVESLLGYPPSHWLYTQDFLAGRIHPEDREPTLELYRNVLDRGGEASAEFRAIAKSGEVIWCRETILAPKRGAAAEPRKISGVLTGLRQRKELEQRMIAAERNAALTSLSARLAHDLNNPLMIITGYAEEMNQTFREDDPRREDVERILGATQRIADLTAQLLRFTRKPAPDLKPVDLSAELSRLEGRLAAAAGTSTALTISVGAPMWALADASRLEEILTALVSSQLEQAEGRTRLTVACDEYAVTERLAGGLQPGVYARITVEDNGKGLSPERRMAVFEQIFAKEPQKSGAALAHVYALLRQWGGDIAVESDPFRGARFSILLPRPEPAAEPQKGRETAVQTPAPPPEAPGILVVDDEPGIRALVAKILRRERYNVIEASSVREAISAAQSRTKRLDLLVTDVMLPDESGRELAERLTRAVPGIKVLYISGFTDNEAVRLGEFPPGAKFLQKPFTLGALVGKVREALQD